MMAKRRMYWLGLFFALTWLTLLSAPPAWAAGVVMDGEFSDWEGQATLADPEDMKQPEWDMLQFSWANDDENLYFYIKRLESDQPENYELYFDLDNNGSYSDKIDAMARIYYHPKQDKDVRVTLFHGDGGTDNYAGPWGASLDEGGNQVEFSIPVEALSLSQGQSIGMFVASTQDRLPDAEDVLWSPIPIMGTAILAVVAVGALAFFAWSIKGRRKA